MEAMRSIDAITLFVCFKFNQNQAGFAKAVSFQAVAFRGSQSRRQSFTGQSVANAVWMEAMRSMNTMTSFGRNSNQNQAIPG